MPKKTGSSNFPRAIGDSINEMIWGVTALKDYLINIW